MTQVEKLQKASVYCLYGGDLKGYCETLVRLGEWQMALTIAPTVSKFETDFFFSFFFFFFFLIIADDCLFLFPYRREFWIKLTRQYLSRTVNEYSSSLGSSQNDQKKKESVSQARGGDAGGMTTILGMKER
jgi:hypothetical protein